MPTKKQKHIESTKKIIVLFGLAALIVSIAASLYGAYFSKDFIREPLDAVYYLRYMLLLGGGFAAGYYLVRKTAKQSHISRLFVGVVYSLLAVSLYLLTDILRLMIGNSLGFPWGKILFFGAPLIALGITVATALFMQVWRRQSEVSIPLKVTLISSFVLYQLYILSKTVYYLSAGSITYAEDMPPLLIVGSYLITPLVITALAYLFLAEKCRLERVFYAAIVGSFYALLQLTLWDFNRDPSAESYKTASLLIILSSLLFSAALLWNLRLKRGKRY